MERAVHWEHVYRDKGDAELSWFQSRPGASAALVESLRPTPRRAIDVGGGQSALPSALLALGVPSVTVLDIAPSAIARGKARLGADDPRVRWVVADVLDPRLPELVGREPFDLWHDRAVFHFLTDPAEQSRYADAARRLVEPGGWLVVSAFALDGPERCSGLPVQRHDASTLASAFGEAFRLEQAHRETHRTPWGKEQSFTCTVLRRA